MDFESNTTSIASISYIKKRIMNIKIYDMIIKLVDEKVIWIAYLDKGTIRRFCQYLFISNRMINSLEN